MRKSYLAIMALAGGVLGGLLPEAMSAARAWAGRNGSGTYSLPAGNPVVSGTIISSSNYNGTQSDIATALTNSLDRTGQNGVMLAPLLNFSGTVGAPGNSWASDTASGWYRIGANDYGYSLNGAKALELSSAGLNSACTATNCTAVTGTGVGTGSGGSFTGGTSGGGGNNSLGVLAAAGTGSNANGIVGQGDGSGYGGKFLGGTTGSGIFAQGGAGDIGALIDNGTAATGGMRQDALTLGNGDLDMHLVANPSITTALTNRLTPSNIPKAYGRVVTNGSGSCTVSGGFNIASCAANSSVITVTYAQALAVSQTRAVNAFPYNFGSDPMTASLTADSSSAFSFEVLDVQVGANIAGFISLISGTPSTATVAVGSAITTCTCTERTIASNNGNLKCVVSAGTLTITGPNTVTDSIAYTCGPVNALVNPATTIVTADVQVMGIQ